MVTILSATEEGFIEKENSIIFHRCAMLQFTKFLFRSLASSPNPLFLSLVISVVVSSKFKQNVHLKKKSICGENLRFISYSS